MSKTVLVRVDAPHYCAGVVIGRKKPMGQVVVLEAAPILRWALGKPFISVLMYFNEKGYEVLVHDRASNTWRPPR